MSRGMWTKHLTHDGSNVFYYNASKNMSVWQVPPDSLVHEAPKMAVPPTQNQQESEAVLVKSTSEVSSSDSTVQRPDPTVALGGPQPDIAAPSTTPVAEVAPIAQTIADNLKSLQDRLAAVAANAKRATPAVSGAPGTAKRQKANDDQNPQQTAAMQAYLQQKSAMEALAGGSGDDSSKWYVR